METLTWKVREWGTPGPKRHCYIYCYHSARTKDIIMDDIYGEGSLYPTVLLHLQYRAVLSIAMMSGGERSTCKMRHMANLLHTSTDALPCLAL